jgi:hypothetical protein
MEVGMPLKHKAAAALVAFAVAAHAGGWGALGGLGEALQQQGEQMQAIEAQKEMMERQHQMEMERLRYQNERQQAPAAAPLLSPEELERRRLLVDRAHPGWRQLVSTPVYRAWVNNSPPEMQRLVRSVEAADVIYAISVFKRETRQP